MRLAEVYVTFGMKHRGLYRVMFGRPSVARLKDTQDEVKSAYNWLIEAFASASEYPRENAETAWALMHGLTILIQNGWIDEETAMDDQVKRASHVCLSMARTPITSSLMGKREQDCISPINR